MAWLFQGKYYAIFLSDVRSQQAGRNKPDELTILANRRAVRTTGLRTDRPATDQTSGTGGTARTGRRHQTGPIVAGAVSAVGSVAVVADVVVVGDVVGVVVVLLLLKWLLSFAVCVVFVVDRVGLCVPCLHVPDYGMH